jgi:hypothetical protein
MIAKETTAQRAAEIRKLAAELGIAVTAQDMGGSAGMVVRAEAVFAPGDRIAYSQLTGYAYAVLGQFRMVAPGSVWGTDPHSVGGHAGLTGGYVRLNKSGVEKRLARHFR